MIRHDIQLPSFDCVYRFSNTVLGDAPELSDMEKMGDQHNARTDDDLHYIRLFGLQHSNQTDSGQVRRLLRSDGVGCQFVRPGFRLWAYYLRTPVGTVRPEATAICGHVSLRNFSDPCCGSTELANYLHMSLSGWTLC